MDVRDRVVVITGAAGGIGSALARRFHAGGARAVVLADLDDAGVAQIAAELNDRRPGSALGLACNVGVAAEVTGLVARAEDSFGPVDLFCANAGLAIGTDPVTTPDEEWDLIWRVNVMHHVWAARALLPGWLARGEGYLLATASAAGLLSQIGSATYSVTKHGAVAFAEWLAITYGDRGVKVSCLCPQGVNTAMLNAGVDSAGAAAVRAGGRVLEPAEVAEVVVQGLRDERFLILPHPEVAEYEARRTADRDRWLAGMRRLQARLGGDPGPGR